MIEFDGITYSLPGLAAEEIPYELPDEYRSVFAACNGFIALGGALHIRGVCAEPDWHSLEVAWHGDRALSRLYCEVLPDDIPFGQNCLGDQLLLRDGSVHELEGETGSLSDLKVDLMSFLSGCQTEPERWLPMEVLRRFTNGGGRLEPGTLISVYPPFCTKQAANGVSLRAISASDRIGFLSDFAAQISDVADGENIRIVVK